VEEGHRKRPSQTLERGDHCRRKHVRNPCAWRTDAVPVVGIARHSSFDWLEGQAGDRCCGGLTPLSVTAPARDRLLTHFVPPRRMALVIGSVDLEPFKTSCIGAYQEIYDAYGTGESSRRRSRRGMNSPPEVRLASTQSISPPLKSPPRFRSTACRDKPPSTVGILHAQTYGYRAPCHRVRGIRPDP